METEKMVTADKLPSINAKLPPQEKLIRVFNPNGKKIREEFHSRKLFDKVLKKKGWIELGNEDISEVLTKNRPKTPAELVLEEENRKLREEMDRLKGGDQTKPNEQPVNFALNTNPIDFDLSRNAADITADLETIDRVATLNEILAAEKAGQDRAGVKQSIIKRITDLS